MCNQGDRNLSALVCKSMMCLKFCSALFTEGASLIPRETKQTSLWCYLSPIQKNTTSSWCSLVSKSKGNPRSSWCGLSPNPKETQQVCDAVCLQIQRKPNMILFSRFYDVHWLHGNAFQCVRTVCHLSIWVELQIKLCELQKWVYIQAAALFHMTH